MDTDEAAMLLHQYSEWLDADQRLMVGDDNNPRSHDDLVAEFLAGRDQRALPELTS